MSKRPSPQIPDEQSIYVEIGKRIQTERKALGFSQADLAQEVELTREYMSYIENGKSCVSIYRLYKIAHALGIEIGKLLPEDCDAVDG